MHRFSAFLLALALGMMALSGSYFTGLFFQLSFSLTVLLAVVVVGFTAAGIYRLQRCDTPDFSNRKTEFAIAVFIVLAAVACGIRGQRYGDWDAQIIWNLHARYLTTPHWKDIFLPGVSGNSAYPYGLSGFVAFGWRLCGSFSPVVPFVAALIPTLAIPVLVALQHGRATVKSLVFVALAFLPYRYYFALGLAQYADVQIAFLLLLLCMVLHRLRTTRRPAYGWVAGALCGALCWTKMEGFLLAAVFVMSHATLFVKTPAFAVRLAAGVLPFAFLWMLLQASGIPNSPLLISGEVLITHLQDTARLRQTALLFGRIFVAEQSRFVLILLVLYPVVLRLKRQKAQPFYGAVLSMLLGYFLLYVLLVTTDLEWNVTTSLPLLLLQLYPVLVFITARALSTSSSSTIHRFGVDAENRV